MENGQVDVSTNEVEKNLPEELRKKAIEDAQGKIKEVGRKLLETIQKKLDKFEGKPNNEAVRLQIIENLEQFIRECQERKLLLCQDQIRVQLVSRYGGRSLEIELKPNPFEEVR